jgi:uncharacterized protein YicC (UPF0701 family)
VCWTSTKSFWTSTDLPARMPSQAARPRMADRLAPPSPLDLIRVWPGVISGCGASGPRSFAGLPAQQALGRALAGLDEARLSEGGRSSLDDRGTASHKSARSCPSCANGCRKFGNASGHDSEDRLAALTLPTEPNRERFEQELSLALSENGRGRGLVPPLGGHITEVGNALRANEPSGRRLEFPHAGEFES